MTPTTLDKITPGSMLHITVTKTPTNAGAHKTIRRLMRMNTKMQGVLRQGAQRRARTTKGHQRGGRTWLVRQRVPVLVFARKGEKWTMVYRPQLAADLASVSKFIEVSPA